MLEIKVEKFEGPLDLLLELIEKEKLDITEISLGKITDQYLGEVAKLDPKSFDVAEFMLIAARLLYLKSKALLPTLETQEEEQEIEDLKTKLEIYKKYKEAASEFGNILSKNQRSFAAKKPKLASLKFTPPKGVGSADLWKTFQKLIADMPQELSREEVSLPEEKVTIEEKLLSLSEKFKKKQTHRFSDIIKNSKNKLDAIVTFLAILELVKCRELSISQDNNFKEIILKRI